MRPDAVSRYLTFRPRKIGKEMIFPILCAKPEKVLMQDVVVKSLGNVSGCQNVGQDAVYPLGAAFLKKFFVPNKSVELNPCREINALVALEENGLVKAGIQRGLYGICNADGDVLVVSQKVNGLKPDVKINKYNSDNLKVLVKTFESLDTPSRYWDYKKPFRWHKSISVPMHYDLNPNKILISEKDASVIGFEYLDFFRLKNAKRENRNVNWGVRCNYSDVGRIPSNLRNFEICSFAPYLENFGKANPEARELFLNYLILKRDYHRNMSYTYLGAAVKCFENSLSVLFKPARELLKVCHNIKFKHLHHEKVLQQPTEEVIKAEAMKIQVARFIYLMGQDGKGEKVALNPNQVKTYISKVSEFFETMRVDAKGAQKTYWDDCKALIAEWKEIIPSMEDNFKKAQFNYLDDVSGVVPRAEKVYRNLDVDAKPIVTFDEIIAY